MWQVVGVLNQPASSTDVARQFRGARAGKVGELLETLALLGQVQVVEGQRYVA